MLLNNCFFATGCEWQKRILLRLGWFYSSKTSTVHLEWKFSGTSHASSDADAANKLCSCNASASSTAENWTELSGSSWGEYLRLFFLEKLMLLLLKRQTSKGISWNDSVWKIFQLSVVAVKGRRSSQKTESRFVVVVIVVVVKSTLFKFRYYYQNWNWIITWLGGLILSKSLFYYCVCSIKIRSLQKWPRVT